MPLLSGAGGPGFGVELGDNPAVYAVPGPAGVRGLKGTAGMLLLGPVEGPYGEYGVAISYLPIKAEH
jgi:hypothetical protein